MPECVNCGDHVSVRFATVFGLDGDVTACPSCSGRSNIADTITKRR